jgi:phosphate starvation-inducible PhoH-like protein
MSKSKVDNSLGFLYKPQSPAQEEAEELWKRSRILFLLGPSGCGKTACALGMSLKDILKTEKNKLLLSRPLVTCEEDVGFLPGDLDEKLGPWMGSFHDVFGSLSTSEWHNLQLQLQHRLELVQVGMLRGRTIRDGVLIVDEAQNCSFAQLKCILTRIGKHGKIVICGDTEQSDKFNKEYSPLQYVANKLVNVDTVSVIRFDAQVDQLRDPLVSEILSLL